MYLELFVKYLHFASIFTIVAALAGEYLLLKDQMTRKEIRRLSMLDGLYGISSLTLLAAGLSLWLWVGKPAEFYSKNWVFHLKLGLFVTIGLLSIYPTVFFIRHRKGDEGELMAIPGRIKLLIQLELLLLFIIPFPASLMARGIGAFG